MKNPEPPRSFLPKLTEPPASEDKEEKILPRYVEVPALREHGFGPRNLFRGVAMLLLALVLLALALYFSGPRAAISLGTALLTFTALFVLARLHIFRQRNGGFVALALVCLVGALIPLLESGFVALKNLPARSAPAPASAPAVVTAGDTAPLLTRSFALTPPEGAGRQIKVLKDSRIVIGERPFLIKAGDRFPLLAEHADEVTFEVRDLRLALPANVVEVLDPTALAQGVAGDRPAPDLAEKGSPALPAAPPTAEELAAITAAAQREAVRRYPALGIRDSFENEAFVSTYQQLKNAKSADFFVNPEWPIELAELLAKREGWVRGAGPMTTSPAPVLDAPEPLPPLDSPEGGAGAPANRAR